MVAARLSAVGARIAAAAARVGRAPEEVTLVAVGKAHPLDTLRAAYDAGHRTFGENRAQELVEKAAAMPDDVVWHFVGPLQSNKARLVRPIATLLHSMDRASLAAAWLKGPGTAPPVLVEVNLGEEPQKAGVPPAAAAELVAAVVGKGIEVRGLMAIPPITPDPEGARPYFRRLAALRSRLSARWPQITELSMGMTDDFEVAVEEGATIVRVGRAIFGPRPAAG